MFSHIPRWLRLVVYVQIALVIAIPFGGWLLQRWGESSDMGRFPPPGKLVSLGEFQVHVYCEGPTGATPVVVYNADISDHGLVWTTVLKRTASFARSCYVDRPGMGWSEAGGKDRSITTVAREIQAALEAAGERAPYLLVGHGLGALHMVALADAYPDRTAGLVLVDPVPPVCLNDRFDGIVARVTGPAQSEIRSKLDEIVRERGECPDGEGGTELLPWLARIGMVRALAGKNFDPTSPSPDLLPVHRALKLRTQFAEATIAESQTAYVGLAAAREALRKLGETPVRLISKGRVGNFFEDQEFLKRRADENTLAFENAQLSYLQDAHTEMIAGLPRASREIASGSGHYVMLSEPEVVADAVKALVESAPTRR